MKVKKVSIIGVGFMGGSLALAIKKAYPEVSLWGYAYRKEHYKRLKRLNLVDRVTGDLRKLLKDATMVVLATPVSTIVGYFKKIAPFLAEGTVVIDLGSTKYEIEKKAKEYLPKSVNFVGCHPLCGSNKEGPENASRDIYKNSLCIITSFNKATPFVEKFWRRLGCRVYFMKSSLHDKVLSYVSHLPHVISYALSYLVPKKYFSFSSGSFSYITRVSTSPEKVWEDVFFSNKDNIANHIEGYIGILKEFKRAITSKDHKRLLRLIRKARKKHLSTR